MQFFGEFSGDPVWKSLEARDVNNTGILVSQCDYPPEMSIFFAGVDTEDSNY